MCNQTFETVENLNTHIDNDHKGKYFAKKSLNVPAIKITKMGIKYEIIHHSSTAVFFDLFQGLWKLMKSVGPKPKSRGSKTKFQPKFICYCLILPYFHQKWGKQLTPLPPVSEGPVNLVMLL